WRDGLAAVPEGHERFTVPPADDEVREQVGVSPGRHCLEGIAAEELTARGQSSRADRLPRGLGEPGEVEDPAGWPVIRLEKLHQERAVPAADVHYRPELSEVVGLDQRAEPIPDPSGARHRSIEQ